MTLDDYKKKYGDAIVMGVDADVIGNRLKDGLSNEVEASNSAGNSLYNLIAHALRSKLRCEAECDPSFKQVIPYVVLTHRPTNRIYVTTRIGGDERLVTQSSIGLGGHMDMGEGIVECLCRELKEEVGLDGRDFMVLAFNGYIYSSKTEVDSVHMGLLFMVSTDKENITCLEEDKLTGGWYTVKEIGEMRDAGKLESWSEVVYDQMLALYAV